MMKTEDKRAEDGNKDLTKLVKVIGFSSIQGCRSRTPLSLLLLLLLLPVVSGGGQKRSFGAHTKKRKRIFWSSKA